MARKRKSSVKAIKKKAPTEKETEQINEEDNASEISDHNGILNIARQNLTHSRLDNENISKVDTERDHEPQLEEPEPVAEEVSSSIIY